MLVHCSGNFHANAYLNAADELGYQFSSVTGKPDHFIIYNGTRELRLHNSWLGCNDSEGERIANDKELTHNILKKRGIPVPDQKVFLGVNGFSRSYEFDDIYNYAQKHYPVVVKTPSESLGRGVFEMIQNEDELTAALSQCLQYNREKVIIESCLPGIDYRILVSNGQVIDIIERQPVTIIGNGKDSIRTILDYRNEFRKQQLLPELRYTKRLQTNLQKFQLSFERVLEKGYKLTILGTNNLSQGGEFSRFAIDKVPESNLNVCFDAARSIGLVLAGVDFKIPDINLCYKNQVCGILEVNHRPQLRSHTLNGGRRDFSVPKKILQSLIG